MADTVPIPVVDFSHCGLDVDKDNVDFAAPNIVKLAKELYQVCSTVGFVYLRNHGIGDEEIEKARNKVEEFFQLPVETKEKYERTGNHGWVRLERERVNPERPGDLKECYNATPALADPTNWPDKEVPEFKTEVMNFLTRCDTLALRILKVLALGLELEDLGIFSKQHNVFSKPNCSTLRFLYYPPITMDVKPGQIRLGEHTDYGSITLLFQDNVGGLEVQTREGKWAPATPIPGTLLLNIADAMQRWTADRLTSTPHRVLLPKDTEGRTKERRSIAYFVHPDEDCIMKCVDGSDKYSPVLHKDYLDAKFNATY